MSINSSLNSIKTAFLNITTFQSEVPYSASHFYGKIHFFIECHQPSLNQKITDYLPPLSYTLEREITLLDAKKLDYKDNTSINVQMYKRGYNRSLRHDTIDQVINSAITKIKSMNIVIPIYIFHQGILKNNEPVNKIENICYTSKINSKMIVHIVSEYNVSAKEVDIETFIENHPLKNHIISL